MRRTRPALFTIAIVGLLAGCASHSTALEAGSADTTTTAPDQSGSTDSTTSAQELPGSTDSTTSAQELPGSTDSTTAGVPAAVASLDLAATADDFDFWAHSTAAVSEVEYYRSLAEMAGAATAVVVGRVVDTASARIVATDTPEDVFRIERFIVEVDLVVRGELLVGGPEIVLEPSLSGLTDRPPPSRALLFLRYKGENRPPGETAAVAAADRQAYRLVSAQGVLIELDGAALNPSAVHERRSDPVNADAAGRTLREIAEALDAG